MVTWRDPPASIPDSDHNELDRFTVLLVQARTQPHSAPGRREFECIAEEVHENVHDLVSIAVDGRNVRWHAAFENELLARDQRLIQRVYICDNACIYIYDALLERKGALPAKRLPLEAARKRIADVV